MDWFDIFVISARIRINQAFRTKKMKNKQEKTFKENDVMVLLENINNGIEVIAESQQQLQADMTEVKEDVAELKTDVAELKTDVAVLKKDVSELKTDVAVLKTDVAELKTDVSVLKTDVSELKTDMTDVKEELSEIKFKLDRKVSYDDFEKLEKRVLRLESARG